MYCAGVAELTVLESDPAKWRVGAAVTLTQVWDALGTEFPALASMLRWFGSRQIRNRATLGGNLATASPIGDSAPVLLALDATIVLVSLKASGDGKMPVPLSERTLPIADFFVSYRK